MGIDSTMFTTGGNLTGNYRAAEVHFHWGSRDAYGSEHGINNNKFPLEVGMLPKRGSSRELNFPNAAVSLP